MSEKENRRKLRKEQRELHDEILDHREVFTYFSLLNFTSFSLLLFTS